MRHPNNVVEFFKYRERERRRRGLEIEDWFVTQEFLRSFDGLYYCKWCGRPMRAVEYDRRKGDIILSCDKWLCPGNYSNGPRKMPNWKKYKMDEMTNQHVMNERAE